MSVGKAEMCLSHWSIHSYTVVDGGHMKFSGTHRKCIEYLTVLIPLIAEN